MIKKYFNKLVKNYYYNKFKVFPEIQVQAGLLRYNYMCHFNATHDAINNFDNRIALCVVIDNNRLPVIHFINVGDDNTFVDNTYGHWNTLYRYYLIKYIDKPDFFDVDKIFLDYRNEIRNELPLYLSLFSDYNC